MDDFDKSSGSFIESVADRLGMGLRGKLIAVFLVSKVIPLIILTAIAWYQINILGETLREQATADSVVALNQSAIENIERTTTDIADELSKFLYSRDADINYLATIRPEDDDYANLVQHYQDFMDSKIGRVIEIGEWALAPDGMSWVRTDASEPALAQEAVSSSNAANNDVISGSGFHYRPPDTMSYRTVPYYDEIVFLDVDLKERAKVVSQGSTKKNYPLSSELKDVSNKANTYVGSETYGGQLSRLGVGEIYVSDVIGVYVPSHFVGIYTPKRMAIRAVDAAIASLEATGNSSGNNGTSDGTNSGANSGSAGGDEAIRLIAALTTLKSDWIPALVVEKADKDNAVFCAETSTAIVAQLDMLKAQFSSPAAQAAIEDLQKQVAAITFDPEGEAYAGAENPNGARFEGIIRWIEPVYDSTQSTLLGYVSFALNSGFIMEFVDHESPLPVRYTSIADASEGNYAFIWDYQCRCIAHPRHFNIVGYDPATGLEEIPWLESSLYDTLLKRSDSLNLAEFKQAWPSLLYDPEQQDNENREALDLIRGVPVFDEASYDKQPAKALEEAGYLALDGRYLNNAPQCTGWMDLTQDGGSGSFYMQWSGLTKLTTVATIPYYTGQYKPSAANGFSKRGFGMVTIGAGLEDFQKAATETDKVLTAITERNLEDTAFKLLGASLILMVVVVFIAIKLSGYLTRNIRQLIAGIRHFCAGQRQFRFNSEKKDEFGVLADSFDDMADSVVASVSSPMSIVDKEHRVIYMNPAGLHFADKTLDAVVGTPYSQHSIYTVDSDNDPISAHEQGREAEVVYLDGRYFHGVASDFLSKDGEKLGYYVVTTDVTEIQQAREKAEQASEAKTSFLSNMSHEMRTPLNAVIGMTAIGKAAEDNTRKDYCFTKIDEASNHLLGVINDILDISKIEARKFELSSTEFDLEQLLQRVAYVMIYRIGEKQQHFSLHFDQRLPRTVVADDQHLAQVLTNLLANAVKFTGEGGSIGLEAVLADEDEQTVLIRFNVNDTGIGVSAEQIERIFSEFEQAESSISRSYGGTGLGLSISRNIVEMMGGTIEVTSQPGEGSTFYFEIRVEKGSVKARQAGADKFGADAGADAAEQWGADAWQDGCFEGCHILLVEDNAVNQEIVIALLEFTSVTIECADEGRQAIALFTANPEAYDLILMDIQMPVMDGMEATRNIRSLEAPKAKVIPIIAMTANVFREEVRQYLEAGMNDHIGKPLDIAILVSKLGHYLGRGTSGSSGDHGNHGDRSEGDDAGAGMAS
ncbi:MAG: response regulator [Coriobacteriales bacterium]|jgi:signal transduction histidine kinase/HAMP domain-containing protein|nr:response regulator [Coriobacteriales bacterium]